MPLFKMLDFGDVLCRMSEMKSDILAVPACRETSAFDNGNLLWHVGVTGSRVIIAGLRHDFARLPCFVPKVIYLANKAESKWAYSIAAGPIRDRRGLDADY